MMKIHKSILILAGALMLACGQSDEHPETNIEQHTTFSDEQKALAGVQTGRLQRRVLSPVVSSTGEIEVPPQGMASVSVPLGGYLVRTTLVPGDYVRKGQRLAELSNPEYITLQQSWLETSGQLKFASQDYERQKTLQAHDATAGKRLQESESAYAVLKARLAGLREQLRMVGIDMRRLENGEIQSVVTLNAPVNGYITRVNHHPGQFIEPREVVFEIVNPDELHLHLNVFERDISGVDKGQKVRFKRAGGGDEYYEAVVSLVSPKRNEELRTFDVHAHIESGEKALKPGMYVEAEILLSNDTVPALPTEAIVNFENKAYVLLESEGSYQPQEVRTGTRMGGWVEIRDPEPIENRNVVVRGGSRLFAALRRASEE